MRHSTADHQPDTSSAWLRLASARPPPPARARREEYHHCPPFPQAPSGAPEANEPGTVWTIAQLRAFLATASQHRLFSFFHVAAYTGVRRGELLNLRWTDIDLDAKRITITGSTAVIGGERVKWDDQKRPGPRHFHR